MCGYIDFRVECTIPQKIVKKLPNNKSWITKRIKGIINRKKPAFENNEKEEYRFVQKELKEEIRKEKEQYLKKKGEKKRKAFHTIQPHLLVQKHLNSSFYHHPLFHGFLTILQVDFSMYG